MTEEEWLRATRPGPAVGFLHVSGSERKARLFAVACCRRILNLITDDRARRAVELAEQYADDLLDQSCLTVAEQIASEAWEARTAYEDRALEAPASAATRNPWAAAWWAASSAAEAVGVVDAPDPSEERAQVVLLRDIFGNPFRPVTLDPAWLTSTVVELAQGIYDERAFDRLPILADALQDAGCDNDDVLNHCRGDGPHVRGCWVVDGILGKT